MSNIQHLWPNPLFHLCISLASFHSILISSLLSPFSHHSIPAHFLVRWGFARQKVTEMSLLHTHNLPLLVSPPHFLPHTLTVFLVSVSHMRMHTLLNVSSSLSVLSPLYQYSLILSLSLHSREYSTYIIPFGQAPWADIIQEVTDYGL